MSQIAFARSVLFTLYSRNDNKECVAVCNLIFIRRGHLKLAVKITRDVIRQKH